MSQMVYGFGLHGGAPILPEAPPSYFSENFLDGDGKQALSAWLWADGADSQAADNDLNAHGSFPTFTDGRAVFNGSTQGLTRAHASLSSTFPGATTAADFTMLAKDVIWNTTGDYQCALSKDIVYMLLTEGGKITLYIWGSDGGSRSLQSTTALTAGRAYDVAFRYTHATRTVELFIDGVREDTDTLGASLSIDAGHAFYVGSSGLANGAPFNRLNGSIGNVGVFVGAGTLTDAEIAHIALFGLAGRDLGMWYDDFQRADTSNGVYGSPPQGQAPAVILHYDDGTASMVPASKGRTENRMLVADVDSIIYCKPPVAHKIRRWRVGFSFLANPDFDSEATFTGEGVLALFVSSPSDTVAMINDMGLHAGLAQANGCGNAIRRDGEMPFLELGSLSAGTLNLQRDGRMYEAEVWADDDGNWGMIVDGHEIGGNHADIASRLSRNGAFEIYQTGTNIYNFARLHYVCVYHE